MAPGELFHSLNLTLFFVSFYPWPSDLMSHFSTHTHVLSCATLADCVPACSRAVRLLSWRKVRLCVVVGEHCAWRCDVRLCAEQRRHAAFSKATHRCSCVPVARAPCAPLNTGIISGRRTTQPRRLPPPRAMSQSSAKTLMCEGMICLKWAAGRWRAARLHAAPTCSVQVHSSSLPPRLTTASVSRDHRAVS